MIPFTYCITFAFQQYRYSQFFMITINLIGGLDVPSAGEVVVEKRRVS